MNEKKKPNWDSFVPYKGEDENIKMPGWAENSFQRFMVLVCLLIYCGVCGFIGTLFSFGGGSEGGDSSHGVWMRFGIGAAVGLVPVVIWYIRRRPDRS